MTITITEGGSFSVTNSISDPTINPAQITNNDFTIASATNSQIVLTAPVGGGATLTVNLNGSFNATAVNNSGITNLGTFINSSSFSSFSSGTVTSIVDYIGTSQLQSTSFSSPVNAILSNEAGSSTLAANILYAGQQVILNTNTKGSEDSWYGYTGYATLNENHVYSSHPDIFVGGSGGINTLVLPGASSSYTISTSNTIFDKNSQQSNLTGFVITDTKKVYTTVDVSAVQRVQFSDTSLALDVLSSGSNAGEVAKILGAVFGASYATNKSYMGIGLYYADSGMSYANLMNLALTAKLGANYSNSAEIQQLYSNLFGHSATTNEVTTLSGFIGPNATYTQATFAVMAAESTNNIANINLVGLASTGIQYTPYHG